jgi:hypothetical protein
MVFRGRRILPSIARGVPGPRTDGRLYDEVIEVARPTDVHRRWRAGKELLQFGQCPAAGLDEASRYDWNARIREVD